MFNLISIRATFCRNGRLAPDGRGLLQIECSQQKRRIYFSAKVKVLPEQFKNGQVVNHPVADSINLRIQQIIYDLHTIEMECLRRGVPATLEALRQAWYENSRPSARLIDFGQEMLNSSASRKDATKLSYKTLFNSIEKFRPNTLLQDVDYTFVCKYDTWLKNHGSGHNTRVCRLRLLRTIMIEAKKRNIIQTSPFERFKIPAMTSKIGHLTESQVGKIEKLNLAGKLDIARDAFLFSVYTGLRFSDIRTLRNEHLQKDWLVKRMVKTELDVRIPIKELFEGKAVSLIEKYGSIEGLTSKVGSNATMNKRLKDVLKLVKCDDKGFTFHTARHTFATLLLQNDVQMSTVQKLLGHSDIKTTSIYAEFTDKVITNDIRKTKKRKTNNGG